MVEYKLYFKNNHSSVYINDNYIVYNNDILPIVNVYHFSDYIGKIATEELILKWSKKELHIYDKTGSITFIDRLQEHKNEDFYIKTATNEDSSQVIETYLFELSKDYKIKFNIFTNAFMLTEIKNNVSESIEMKEHNISKNIKEYISQQGDILYIDNKNKRYRWRNIPIGKLN